MATPQADAQQFTGHSHRFAGTTIVKKDHLAHGARTAKVDTAALVLKALDDDHDASSPQPSPHPSPGPGRRTTRLSATLVGKPTTISLEDLIASPARGSAIESVPLAIPTRADDLERAIFDTRSSQGGDHGGTGWPAGSKLSMPVRVVNRWGHRSKAEIEVELGRMRYSKRVYHPADLLDFAYDERDETALVLQLAPRRLAKRILCDDHVQRETLASWLAAWKIGWNPSVMREMSGSTAVYAGGPGGTLSGSSSLGSVLRNGSTRGSAGGSSTGATGVRGRAPSGRTGRFELPGLQGVFGRQSAPRDVTIV